MSQISNKVKFTNLSQYDIEFMDRITTNITASSALPFELPEDAFFATVVKALKKFWTWYPSATMEKKLFIPREIIYEASKLSPVPNIDLLLPNGIEAVYDWKSANSMGYGSRNVDSFLRISLLSSFNMTGAGGNRGGGYGNSPLQMSNVVISMYEAAQYKETFQRGIHATFNKNTQIFRLMTNVPDGLVLTCAVRLFPEELYGDELFDKYVEAAISSQLSKILKTFDFQLPGDITINFDQIENEGKDAMKEIEEELKDMNANDMIMMK